MTKMKYELRNHILSPPFIPIYCKEGSPSHLPEILFYIRQLQGNMGIHQPYRIKTQKAETLSAFLIFRRREMNATDITYTIQLTEPQHTALLERAAELQIPLEDLLLQAMQNFLKEEPSCLR